MIASGNYTYLAIPSTVEMVRGHCLIVPAEHVLTTLDCEDNVWDEIRVESRIEWCIYFVYLTVKKKKNCYNIYNIQNFMKCVIQMQWESNKGVIFMEQVINHKWHKHTVIECIPIPMDKYEQAPAYFRVE